MNTVKCETVTVEIWAGGNHAAVLTVPAYTRTAESTEATITAWMGAYIAASLEAGNGTSVGDFALYLLDKAAREPREQDGPA